MRYTLLIIVTLLLNVHSFGQTNTKKHNIDKELKVCLDADGSTQGMIACLNEAEIKWDKELNKYYKLLLEKLSSSEKLNLKETQRQWIAYRDKEFLFISELYGNKEGTMWALALADNRNEIVKKRALELIGYYEMLTQN